MLAPWLGGPLEPLLPPGNAGRGVMALGVPEDAPPEPTKALAVNPLPASEDSDLVAPTGPLGVASAPRPEPGPNVSNGGAPAGALATMGSCEA
mmetsp:Transcript_14336/g.26804  ORF Transcript_14336/g.26804 Transcript_14336/m.26804 type:complete len:93 (+) Transcript_14336:352-630(+)